MVEFNPQWLAFAGIVFEIIGFILMAYKWNKIPRIADYQTWHEIHSIRHQDWFADSENQVWIDVEDVQIISRQTVKSKVYRQVPKQFISEWNWKTKYYPIGFVIFGLSLQGLSVLFFF